MLKIENLTWKKKLEKRVIRQMIENPLSKEILAQKFIDGDCIKIDVADDEITFSK